MREGGRGQTRKVGEATPHRADAHREPGAFSLQRDQGGARCCWRATVLTVILRAWGSAPCVESECSRPRLSSVEMLFDVLGCAL